MTIIKIEQNLRPQKYDTSTRVWGRPVLASMSHRLNSELHRQPSRHVTQCLYMHTAHWSGQSRRQRWHQQMNTLLPSLLPIWCANHCNHWTDWRGTVSNLVAIQFTRASQHSHPMSWRPDSWSFYLIESFVSWHKKHVVICRSMFTVRRTSIPTERQTDWQSSCAAHLCGARSGSPSLGQ